MCEELDSELVGFEAHGSPPPAECCACAVRAPLEEADDEQTLLLSLYPL